MLTPRPSISNLHQTLVVPGAQDTQSTQRASVEGVTARNQGPIELSQMPGRYPTSPEQAPEPFTPSVGLMERANKLRQAMHVQGANGGEAQQKAHILEKAIIHGKYLEECTKHAEANNVLHTLPRFPEVEAALGFENPLFVQVDNSLTQAQEELQNAIQLRGGERGRAPASTANLKEQMKQQVGLFDKHLQDFEAARKQASSKQDREAILKAELHFSLYATQTTSSIPSTISSMRDVANLVIGELQDKLNSKDASGPEAARVESLLGEWREASTALDETLTDLVPELETAVARSKLAETIKDLQDSGSWGKQLHAMVGQGLRQFVLSGFALGLVNSYSSDLLSKTPLPEPIQMILGAGFTALAHDFGSHALAAGVLELVGGATKPVNARDVTSTTNRLIYDNGHVREKTADEIQVQRDLQAKFEKELKYADNANKLGTVWSETKYASIFGTVQTAGSLIASGPGFSTIGSLIAGGIVGALIGEGGMNATAKEPGGRDIPAMEPKPTSGTLSGAKAVMVDTVSKKMNYLTEENRKAIQNKFGGLLTGAAVSRMIEFIANIIEARFPNAGKGVQATATALSTVANLLALYGSMKIADEAKAYKAEREARTPAGEETGEGYFNLDRPKALATLGRHPNHPAIKQVFPEGSAGRVVTNMADSVQRGLNIPMATVNSLVTEPLSKLAIEKGAEGIGRLRNNNAQPDVERDAPDNA